MAEGNWILWQKPCARVEPQASWFSLAAGWLEWLRSAIYCIEPGTTNWSGLFRFMPAVIPHMEWVTVSRIGRRRMGIEGSLSVGQGSDKRLRGRACDGQLDGDTRTLRLQIFNSKIAAVFFGDPVTNAQPQSGAFANRFRRIERVQRSA